jgi:hypothetical protein
MLRKPANDWHLLHGGTDQKANKFLFDILFSLRPTDVERLLSEIKEFEGTKILVSCTDRTPLRDVLKLALCLADLIILVPAPLWSPCVTPSMASYREFNRECVGRGGWWFSSMSLLDKLSTTVTRVPELFAEGTVRFLPFLGQSMHRWSHPDLQLPELPRPYANHPQSYTLLDIHREALFNLYSERLASDAMGAIHLNSASFVNPVVDDFVVSRENGKERSVRELVEINIPDLARVSLSDLFRLRHELSDAFSHFSQELVHHLRSDAIASGADDADADLLYKSVSNFRSRLEKRLSDETSEENAPPWSTTVTLGLGEARSGLLQSLECLKESRDLRTFMNLITRGASSRLETTRNSFLGAFERAAEN